MAIRIFAYRAKNWNGQVFSGTITAENEAAAAAFIRSKGYFITRMKEQRPTLPGISFKSLRPVSAKDLAVLCWQFSTMSNAGICLITALNTLIEQTCHPRLKKALRDILQKVQEGSALSLALAGHPAVFPALMVNMVEAGETGGVLDEVLGRLAVHYEKEYKLNEKVKSALTYPAMVLGVAALVVAFIMSFVLPAFLQMFSQMQLELPLPTRLLLKAGELLQCYWPLLPALTAGAAGFTAYAYKQPQYRLILDHLLLKLPVFGLMAKKTAIARFSRTFGTLLNGGVPITRALEVVKKTTGNLVIINMLAAAERSIHEGSGLAAPLNSRNIFPPLVIQMVAAGEETGKLDKMLDKIADFYESEVDDTVSRLGSLVEPVIIGILGIVIGGIVLAVALPMFDAVHNAGQ